MRHEAEAEVFELACRFLRIWVQRHNIGLSVPMPRSGRPVRCFGGLVIYLQLQGQMADRRVAFADCRLRLADRIHAHTCTQRC